MALDLLCKSKAIIGSNDCLIKQSLGKLLLLPIYANRSFF